MRAPTWCAPIAAILITMASAANTATPEGAKALIARGDLVAAKAMLEQELRSGRGSTEVHFLLGLIAVQEQDYREAITHFRAALGRDPHSARLRLELGRAFYLAKDYPNAELQFERALAGDLPAPVQANARRFLDLIRRGKRWSYDFNIAFAPDTNINAGSSANEAVIFGLPFQLGKDAKMHSGVGIVGGASVGYSVRLSDRLRLRSGVTIRRSEYKGTRFDDTIASGWSGPQWFGRSFEIGAEATVLLRWYGARPYQRAIGGRVEAISYHGRKTALLLAIAGQDFDYPTFRAQSGPVWSATAGVVRTLDPTTSVSLLISGARQKARTEDLSNRSILLSLSATHDFHGGFTLTVRPAYAIADYDAPDALFGVTRRDRSKEFNATLLNRRVAIWRFTPTITYSRLRRSSTIGLYDSRQDRMEIGLTSTF